ncbi:MAG: hypothetical protein RR280_04350 [Bacteroidaceae bacterium]
MSISLKNLSTGEVVTLPPELFWQDEFDWSNVKSTHGRGITGALHISQSIAKGGRPITLGAKTDMDWARRDLVERLYQWGNTPSLDLEATLSYNASVRVIKARFNHTLKPVEASPVREYEAPDPADDFHLKLNLMEIV